MKKKDKKTIGLVLMIIGIVLIAVKVVGYGLGLLFNPVFLTGVVLLVVGSVIKNN